ncbi:hypothetical protein BD410DRAFT_792904 [Rickenella mellea]|uniref:Uncharacterized protein n=1 Tax=Rickenella mellea TaxID=50990 RepID=A0A4Y7PTJ9_9AGAM|nr:hypothetical protein BD410DRAFT_792904 [Rickenella mellea]
MINPETSDKQNPPARAKTVPNPSLAPKPALETLEKNNSPPISPTRLAETSGPSYQTTESSRLGAMPTLLMTGSPDTTTPDATDPVMPGILAQCGVACSKNSVTYGTGIPDLVKAQDPKTTDPEKHDNAPEVLQPKEGHNPRVYVDDSFPT